MNTYKVRQQIAIEIRCFPVYKNNMPMKEASSKAHNCNPISDRFFQTFTNNEKISPTSHIIPRPLLYVPLK